MNTSIATITSYLEAVRSVRKQCGSLNDYVYYGNEDFLLQHGRWYTPKPLPPRMWRGAPRCCFGNAIVMAAMYGLPYIEGYSIADADIGFPVHHAWNADKDGSVLDSTWRNPGTSYFGVEFSVERADDATWNGDASVLDDWRRGWPLFKSPWKGEDYSIQWPPSPRINAIKRSNPCI